MTVLYTLLFFLFSFNPPMPRKIVLVQKMKAAALSREILGTLQILSHEVANHEE